MLQWNSPQCRSTSFAEMLLLGMPALRAGRDTEYGDKFLWVFDVELGASEPGNLIWSQFGLVNLSRLRRSRE